MTTDVQPIIDICGKRTLEYVMEVLAKFNRGAEQVSIRAFGGNSSKVIGVAHILSVHFNIVVESVRLSQVKLANVLNPSLEIDLRCDSTPGGANTALASNVEFTPFPVYNLLFDSLLKAKGSFDIADSKGGALIQVEKSRWEIKCKPLTWRPQQPDRGLLNRIASAYYRSGLLLSPSWHRVAQILTAFDDVVIAHFPQVTHGISAPTPGGVHWNSSRVLDPDDPREGRDRRRQSRRRLKRSFRSASKASSPSVAIGLSV